MNVPDRPQILLRPMQLEDVNEVHALDQATFSLPWSERSYRFEIKENLNSSAWVAEASRPEGSPIIAGLLVNWVILDEAHVATIAVKNDFRRMGIGQKLLAKGLLACWEHGARLALLEVRRSNLAAQALYQRFGFQEAGVRRHYYADNGEDAVLMTLESIDPEHLKQLLNAEMGSKTLSPGG